MKVLNENQTQQCSGGATSIVEELYIPGAMIGGFMGIVLHENLIGQDQYYDNCSKNGSDRLNMTISVGVLGALVGKALSDFALVVSK